MHRAVAASLLTLVSACTAARNVATSVHRSEREAVATRSHAAAAVAGCERGHVIGYLRPLQGSLPGSESVTLSCEGDSVAVWVARETPYQEPAGGVSYAEESVYDGQGDPEAFTRLWNVIEAHARQGRCERPVSSARITLAVAKDESLSCRPGAEGWQAVVARLERTMADTVAAATPGDHEPWPFRWDYWRDEPGHYREPVVSTRTD